MSMSYQAFGRLTGLRVSTVALGTSNFGTTPGARTDSAQARRIVDAFAEAGGNFIDTADAYQGGTSEEVLGEVLAGRRDEFVLATKFTRTPDPRAGASATGNSRRNAVRSLEASLRRLRTDYVDVYWVHLPDGVTPVAEILATLGDLIQAGKIRHGGLSNFPAWRVAAAATLDRQHVHDVGAGQAGLRAGGRQIVDLRDQHRAEPPDRLSGERRGEGRPRGWRRGRRLAAWPGRAAGERDDPGDDEPGCDHARRHRERDLPAIPDHDAIPAVTARLKALPSRDPTARGYAASDWSRLAREPAACR